jgi:hypothetical protein
MSAKRTDAAKIQAIIELRESGLQWTEVAEEFNSKFKDNKSAEAVRLLYNRYADFYEIDDEKVRVKSLQKIKRTRDSSALNARENRAILSFLNEQEDIVDQISTVVAGLKNFKLKTSTPPKSTGKTKMVMEAMISDTHYGLKTPTFNSQIARQRMRKYADVFISEYRRHLANYDVIEFVVLLNGDIIQSATMHQDSAYACDSTNPEQVANAIESLFTDFLAPVAALGVKTRVIATPGNHDRFESSRITANPGRSYLSHTIYRALQLLTQQAGMKHISWQIPHEAFAVYDVFGRWFLVEHGDLVKGPTPAALEAQIARRSSQTDRTIIGIRLGHFHQPTTIDLGRFVINGTLASDEHFAMGLGFKSITSQAINFYVETTRKTPYYYSFFANLED